MSALLYHFRAGKNWTLKFDKLLIFGWCDVNVDSEIWGRTDVEHFPKNILQICDQQGHLQRVSWWKSWKVPLCYQALKPTHRHMLKPHFLSKNFLSQRRSISQPSLSFSESIVEPFFAIFGQTQGGPLSLLIPCLFPQQDPVPPECISCYMEQVSISTCYVDE